MTTTAVNNTSSSPNFFWSFIDTIAPVNPVAGYRQFFSVIPESLEIWLGEYVHKSTWTSQGLCYNKQIVDLTERVTNRLAPVTDRKLPYEVKVVDKGVINAFCLPGGKMIMNRGLVEAVMNSKDDFGLGYIPLEDKIAAVMAHESVHAAARHGMRGVEFGLFATAFIFIVAKVAEYALGVFASKEKDPNKRDLAEGLAYLINKVYEHLGDLITTLWQASFSRDSEDESDRFGMVYLKRAGYDPKAMIWVMKFFSTLENKQIPWLQHALDLFRTHDHASNRAAKCEKTLELLKTGQIALSPTSAYKA